jgi:hypothetical protein
MTVRTVAASTFTVAGAANNPAAVGQPVVLAAFVVPLGGGAAPTGTVYFIDGTTLTLLGTGTVGASGSASISVTTLGVGPHLILAYYAGSATLAPSLSPAATVVIYTGTVPRLAGVAVSATPNPSPLGQPVTLRATLTAPAGSPAGTVFFLSDGALAGSGVVTNVGGVFRAEMTTSTLSRGLHVVSALYAGGGSFGMSVSPPFVLTVP